MQHLRYVADAMILVHVVCISPVLCTADTSAAHAQLAVIRLVKRGATHVATSQLLGKGMLRAANLTKVGRLVGDVAARDGVPFDGAFIAAVYLHIGHIIPLQEAHTAQSRIDQCRTCHGRACVSLGYTDDNGHLRGILF